MDQEFIQFLKEEKVMTDLLRSIKWRKSERRCSYVFIKGKKEGEQCPTHISHGCPSDHYCCKHNKYNN